MKPRIKICCISNIKEAELAIKYGASAIGLVGHMPSGPGVINDELIAEIARFVPPAVSTFLLTSETSSKGIISHCKRTGTNTVQLVDEPEPFVYDRIREALPIIKIVQVIHVIDEKSVAHATHISPYVDALLLDSGNPNLAVKVLGGTGKVHNWELSRKIVEKVNKPVFLAGGLNADNVSEAISMVHPYGIDLCSSVRTNGMLDEKKLQQFMKNAAVI